MSFSWSQVLNESGIPATEAESVARRLDEEGYEEKDIPLIDRASLEALGIPLKGVYLTRILAGFQRAIGGSKGTATPVRTNSLSRSESPGAGGGAGGAGVGARRPTTTANSAGGAMGVGNAGENEHRSGGVLTSVPVSSIPSTPSSAGGGSGLPPHRQIPSGANLTSVVLGSVPTNNQNGGSTNGVNARRAILQRGLGGLGGAGGTGGAPNTSSSSSSSTTLYEQSNESADASASPPLMPNSLSSNASSLYSPPSTAGRSLPSLNTSNLYTSPSVLSPSNNVNSSTSTTSSANGLLSPASQERVLFPNGRWKEVKDASTGRSYYYHTITRSTTWFKPDDFVPSPRNESPVPPVSGSSSSSSSSSSASSSSTTTSSAATASTPHIIATHGGHPTSAATPSSSSHHAHSQSLSSALMNMNFTTRPPSSSISSNLSLSSAASTPRSVAGSLNNNNNMSSFLSSTFNNNLPSSSSHSSMVLPSQTPSHAGLNAKRHSTHLSMSQIGNSFDIPPGMESKYDEEPGLMSPYPASQSHNNNNTNNNNTNTNAAMLSPYAQPGSMSSVLNTPVSRSSSFHYQAASAFGFMPTFSQPSSDPNQQQPTLSPTLQLLNSNVQSYQQQQLQQQQQQQQQPQTPYAQNGAQGRRSSTMYDMREFARVRFSAGAPGHSRTGSSGIHALGEALAFAKNLDSPLCKDLTGALATEAIQSFRNITGYMGDRSSSKPASGHIIKLLAHGLRAPSALRDEMYCQLSKQTTGNPSTASNLKGWELLALCCGVFAPSGDLQPFLFNYFEATIKREEVKYTAQDKTMLSHAKYCLEILPRTIANGPRKWVPCELEVDAVKKSSPVSIRVSLQDGSWRTMSFDSQTTVRDVTLLLYKKMNWTNFPLFKEQHCFGLFQVIQDDPEVGNAIPLSESDRMLDVIASWYDNTPCVVRSGSQKSMDFDLDDLSGSITIDKDTNSSMLVPKAKRTSMLNVHVNDGGGGIGNGNGSGGVGGDDDDNRQLRMTNKGGTKAPRRFSVAPKQQHLKYRLEFAPKIFVSKLLSEESALTPEAARLYYYRAVTDVIQGVYNWNEADAVRLAALQMQAEYEQGQPPSSLEQEIHRFFPYHMLIKVGYDFKRGDSKDKKEKGKNGKKREDPAATLMQQALLLRERLRGLTALHARKSYMETVRKQPLYGCTFFRVTQYVAANVSDWSEKLQQKGKAEVAMKALIGSSKNTIKQPSEYVLAISENTLFYIEPSTVQIKGQKPLMSITKYEWTDQTFAYTIGSRSSVVEIEKIYVFKTSEGEQICDYLQLYK